MPQLRTAPLSQHKVQIWPQKWLWSIFWLKLCLESWAFSYWQASHKDEHELINTDTSSDVSQMIFVGESLPWAMLHKHPPSLYIFPKSWCSVIKRSHCTRAIRQQRIFVSEGSASAKQVTIQTGKLLLSCAGDTTANSSTTCSVSTRTTSASHCWHPKTTASHFSNNQLNQPTQLWGTET